MPWRLAGRVRQPRAQRKARKSQHCLGAHCIEGCCPRDVTDGRLLARVDQSKERRRNAKLLHPREHEENRRAERPSQRRAVEEVRDSKEAVDEGDGAKPRGRGGGGCERCDDLGEAPHALFARHKGCGARLGGRGERTVAPRRQTHERALQRAVS